MTETHTETYYYIERRNNKGDPWQRFCLGSDYQDAREMFEEDREVFGVKNTRFVKVVETFVKSEEEVLIDD